MRGKLDFCEFINDHIERFSIDWKPLKNQKRAVFELRDDWRKVVCCGVKKEMQELEECFRLRKFARAKELYAEISFRFYEWVAEEEARRLWNGVDEPLYPEFYVF